MTFYNRMQSTATRLIDKFDQGGIAYIYGGPPTGPEWNPQPGLPVRIPVSGTAKGVEQKYLQDGYITSSDIQVTMPVFEVSPNNNGRVEIDGREHQIIEVRKLPAAGTPVAWIVFCKS